jgi:phosphatidylethanolamine/phosphatidyl-N-methylethanolamine N-methyltransferase
MLEQARRRVAEQRLHHVESLLEMDAEATDFADASFDTAVALFVASVVPNPRRLLAEMRRVVRPGGDILFVNHFAARGGPRWWIERAMAPASHALGWHPDFAMEALFPDEDMAGIEARTVPPFGIFTLVRVTN